MSVPGDAFGVPDMDETGPSHALQQLDGIAWQGSGPAGYVENSRVGGCLAQASPGGPSSTSAFPVSGADRTPSRRRVVGVPIGAAFVTKGVWVSAARVIGDAVYGNAGGVPGGLDEREQS